MLAKSATEGVPERWDRHVFATKHRVTRADSDDPTVTMWEFLQGGRWTMPSEGGLLGLDVTVLARCGPRPPPGASCRGVWPGRSSPTGCA